MVVVGRLVDAKFSWILNLVGTYLIWWVFGGYEVIANLSGLVHGTYVYDPIERELAA